MSRELTEIWKSLKPGQSLLRSPKEAKDFYQTKEWRALRKEFLLDATLVCQACKNDMTQYENRARVHVDHIKPIRVFWDRRLDINNLQVLCDECNGNKGSALTEDANRHAARKTLFMRAERMRNRQFEQRNERLAAIKRENVYEWIALYKQKPRKCTLEQFITNKAATVYHNELKGTEI